METIIIELLLFLVFLGCFVVYYTGKKKEMALLKNLGKSGSLIALVLIISNAVLFYIRRGNN